MTLGEKLWINRSVFEQSLYYEEMPGGREPAPVRQVAEPAVQQERQSAPAQADEPARTDSSPSRRQDQRQAVVTREIVREQQVVTVQPQLQQKGGSALGIGRLIYQLPIPLCKMFIREIFEGKSPDDFDEETLATINKFFENNLNVSETSRQLYIHRNTLVYRLDKLQKSTGLDLRVFEDAITFKIALMVVKYMKYMESMEY